MRLKLLIEYSKIRMLDFSKISKKNIHTFISILSEITLFELENIRRRYINYANNFSEISSFFIGLNLIEVRKNSIILKNDFKQFISLIDKDGINDEVFNNYFLEKLILNKNEFSKYILRFFSFFVIYEENYVFVPNSYQRIEYSGLRNLLIELELLDSDDEFESYKIPLQYSYYLEDNKIIKILSEEDLYSILESRKELSKNAELCIMDYEIKRLSNQSFCNNILLVSNDNVCAGYDILSFENYTNEKGYYEQRFIEVKAVSKINYKFYWSINEINTAKEFSQNYYLYLLPVIKKNLFDIKLLKIINNPYKEIYEKENEWNKETELFSFSLEN